MKKLPGGILVFSLLVSGALADTGRDAPAGHWWDIPYPGRFDAALLTSEQPAISIAGKDFVTADGAPFVFRGVNVGDPDKLVVQGRWDAGLFDEIRW